MNDFTFLADSNWWAQKQNGYCEGNETTPTFRRLSGCVRCLYAVESPEKKYCSLKAVDRCYGGSISIWTFGITGRRKGLRKQST